MLKSRFINFHHIVLYSTLAFIICIWPKEVTCNAQSSKYVMSNVTLTTEVVNHQILKENVSEINCLEEVCVRKCCEWNEWHTPSFECVDDIAIYNYANQTSWRPAFKATMLYGLPPKIEEENLACSLHKEKEFSLKENGLIHQLERGEDFSNEFYCIEKKLASEDEPSELISVICLEVIEKTDLDITADKLHRAGLAVSCVSLALILVLHMLSKREKNIQTKCMISSCINLLLSFPILIVNMTAHIEGFNQNSCIAIAILIQYFTLCFYFWLNVMCYEISRIVRGSINAVPLNYLEGTNLRFMIYAIYSQGVPFIICIVTCAMQFLPDRLFIESYIIRPGIADGRCWFKEDGAIFAYYYGIEIFLHVVNALFMGYATFLLKKDACASLCCKPHTTVVLPTHANFNYVSMFWQQLLVFIMYTFIWSLNCITLIHSEKQFWRIVDIVVTFQGAFLLIIVATSNKCALLSEAYATITGYAMVFRNNFQMSNLPNFSKSRSSSSMQTDETNL